MTILSYNGNQIQQRADGFVNLTQMAQANGVNVNDWLKTQTTQNYLQALESETKIIVSKLLVIQKGGNAYTQGTWAHPLLALNFGRWVNPRFAIWCDQHIKTLIETGSTQIITPTEQPKKKAITYYTDRIMDLKKSLIKPPGTWCVIEKCGHLLMEVERLGYQVAQFDLLDGSVGRRWGSYRKGKSWACVGHKATYIFPDNRRDVIINAYEYPEIGEFMTWLDYSYEPSHLLPYLEEKYGSLAKV